MTAYVTAGSNYNNLKQNVSVQANDSMDHKKSSSRDATADRIAEEPDSK